MLYIFGGFSAPSDIPDFICTVEFPWYRSWYSTNSDTSAVEQNILKSGSPPIKAED